LAEWSATSVQFRPFGLALELEIEISNAALDQRDVKMKAGLSLPYTYISGNLTRSDTIFLSSFGTPEMALSELSSQLEYVELGHFGICAPPDQIAAAVRKIWTFGLKVSLHPALPDQVGGKTLVEIYPWLDQLLPEIKKHQGQLILNVHALTSIDGDETQLRNDTIINLKWMVNLIETEKQPLKIALELNRSKGEIDPCTTYDGVLDICVQVDNPVLGIGWDIGHTYVNYLNGLIPRIPPKEFLDRIIHTHIHDIGSDGSTHWPLVIGTVPLAEYMGLLRERNYEGLYVIELQPQRFAGYGDIICLVLESIEILKNTEFVFD
jgi:sugar phosphate isomerase/epimerase